MLGTSATKSTNTGSRAGAIFRSPTATRVSRHNSQAPELTLKGCRKFSRRFHVMTSALRKSLIYGAPYGIRTRVLALRGPCPRPLDEGSEVSSSGARARYYRELYTLLKH
jgi:hypothetical protein